jgi:hypothetical protein
MFSQGLGFHNYYYLRLHSGDLGSLAALVNLAKLDLGLCVKITGKDSSQTVLLGFKFQGKFSWTSGSQNCFYIHNSIQATSARSQASRI